MIIYIPQNPDNLSGGKKKYLPVAGILTIIEVTLLALGAIAIWAAAAPAMEHLDAAVIDANACNDTTESPEVKEAAYGLGMGFAGQFYFAMVITFTLIRVFLIMVAIHKYKVELRLFCNNDARVVQPTTNINANPIRF